MTLSKWTSIAPAIECRLRAHPDVLVSLDCGRVTGFAPGALFALARLIESAPNRVHLQNWSATASEAAGPLVHVIRLLDGLVADLTERARPLGQSARGDLDESITRLTARVAELKRNWLGDERAPATTRSTTPSGARCSPPVPPRTGGFVSAN
ncbi:unnamed protein product [Gemmata massiliana]|uniref:Uncharacterized protein n=1 Tax=Gemmata massiliana TaxID=1210884 RepID=A0A6P2D2U9_9BACT|nr:hypothetical protein [Gemmata massiliana]VTR94424.1 unnamed protein product [Gemmata massiliana]